MESTSSIIILALSVLFFSYRAYHKGLWRTLLGIAGVIATYIVCFHLGMPFVSLLKSTGLNTMLAYPLGLIAIFIITSFIFSNIPALFFPALRSVSQNQKIYGAMAGIVIGLIIGLFIIWGVTTANALLTLQQAENTSEPITLPAPTSLTATASALVAATVNGGLSVITEEKQHQQLATAFVQAPAELASAFQVIAKAPELKELWQSKDVSLKMAKNDIQGVTEEAAFKRLALLPEMQKILKHTITDSASTNTADAENNTDLFLAEKLTYVWRRMRYTRSDPRVINILNDDEFKALIEKQNPAALLVNPKAQQLTKIIMEKNDMENFDFVSDLNNNGPIQPINPLLDETNEGSSKTHKPIAPPVDPVVVYRWKDNKGKTQYTILENIPDDKKAEAKVFTQ
ncbi:MAG: CvpA family protein [Cellvibrionaceae bacterium]